MSPDDCSLRCSVSAPVVVLAAVIGALSAPAHAQNIVFNGGFETGTFDGWNRPLNVPMQSNFRIEAGGGHSGTYYAQLSSVPLQFMSQTLPTQAGQDYELNFWLRWDFGMAGEFVTVRWEGQPVLSVRGTLQGASWTQFTLPLHANLTGSFLEFGQDAFPLEWHIDDISVIPVPAPSAAPLLLMGGAVALRRRRR